MYLPLRPRGRKRRRGIEDHVVFEPGRDGENITNTATNTSSQGPAPTTAHGQPQQIQPRKRTLCPGPLAAKRHRELRSGMGICQPSTGAFQFFGAASNLAFLQCFYQRIHNNADGLPNSEPASGDAHLGAGQVHLLARAPRAARRAWRPARLPPQGHGRLLPQDLLHRLSPAVPLPRAGRDRAGVGQPVGAAAAATRFGRAGVPEQPAHREEHRAHGSRHRRHHGQPVPGQGRRGHGALGLATCRRGRSCGATPSSTRRWAASTCCCSSPSLACS